MNNIPVYIINLKHRTDRREHIEQEVLKISNNYTIIDGIVDQTKTCFQSQKKCIQLAKENKYDLIVYQGVAYASPAIDITDLVIKSLGK